MELDPNALEPEVLDFLTERHLATLTLVDPVWGEPHVTPVGFTWDADRQVARIITWDASKKARIARQTVRAAVCQVDGGRWLTLYGAARTTVDAERIAQAVDAYAGRYRPPKERPDRVVIELAVERILGRA